MARVRLSLHTILTAVHLGPCVDSILIHYRITNIAPIITAVRVHAINNRNWFWTIIFLALGTSAVLGNIVSPPTADLLGVCPHLLLSEVLTLTAVVGTNSPITLGCYGGLEVAVLDSSTDVWYKSVICASRIHTELINSPTDVIE